MNAKAAPLCPSQARATLTRAPRDEPQRHQARPYDPEALSRLILPGEPLEQVRRLLRACRHRAQVVQSWATGFPLPAGNALIALLQGPPGTGKTHTARVLAQALGQDLHSASLSELLAAPPALLAENLHQTFQEARRRSAMLLLEESDALGPLGMHSLLREMESFEGVVILTSGESSLLPPSLHRRVLYRVSLPVPEAEQRLALWRALLPKANTLDERALDRLSRLYEFTGGQIQNTILRALYESLDDEAPLGLRHLMQAALYEQRLTQDLSS